MQQQQEQAKLRSSFSPVALPYRPFTAQEQHTQHRPHHPHANHGQRSPRTSTNRAMTPVAQPGTAVDLLPAGLHITRAHIQASRGSSLDRPCTAPTAAALAAAGSGPAGGERWSLEVDVTAMLSPKLPSAPKAGARTSLVLGSPERRQGSTHTGGQHQKDTALIGGTAVAGCGRETRHTTQPGPSLQVPDKAAGGRGEARNGGSKVQSGRNKGAAAEQEGEEAQPQAHVKHGPTAKDSRNSNQLSARSLGGALEEAGSSGKTPGEYGMFDLSQVVCISEYLLCCNQPGGYMSLVFKTLSKHVMY